MSLKFPDIDPVIMHVGPLAIRWYSLAYIAGILIGIYYIKYLAKKSNFKLNEDFADSFLLFTIFGIIIGGRLGYVVIYNPTLYIAEPLKILKTWDGGMSFHGGLIGFIIATILFARKYKLNHWKILDLASCVAPIGIFLGRISNFINGELFGRITDSPLGMIFPMGGPFPRHPSQIYEALTEGLLLLLIMNILFFKYNFFKKERLLSGVFCVMYSICRLSVEFFREPDQSVGYILNYFTMGQIISILLALFGIALIKFDPLKKLS